MTPFSHYVYANQTPVRFVDPLGLACGEQEAAQECKIVVNPKYDPKPTGSPPIRRINPWDKREYDCTCSRNPIGAVGEFVGIPGGAWSRNVIMPCLCGNTQEEIEQFGRGYGGVVAQGSLDLMKVSNPGVAAAIFAAEVDTGRTVSINPQQITVGEATWELTKNVGGYLLFRAVSGVAGSQVSQLRTEALTRVSAIQPASGSGYPGGIIAYSPPTSGGPTIARWSGGQSEPLGKYWTRDPLRLQSRNRLGLEEVNSADVVIFAKLKNGQVCQIKPGTASPWGRFSGGGDELQLPRGQEVEIFMVVKQQLPWTRSTDPFAWEPVPLILPPGVDMTYQIPAGAMR